MLDRQALLKLSQFRHPDRPVVTLYLKVDRTSSEPKHVIRLKNLLAEAEARRADYGIGVWAEVQRDLERIATYVRDAYAQGAQHLAIFACGDELFETFSLPYELPTQISLAPSPVLRPLFRQLQRYERYAAALVTQRLGRLFFVTPDEVTEVLSLEGEIPPRHDQGGWAQARLQRHHDEAVAQHLKHVADAILELFQHRGFSGLVLFGTDEVTKALQEVLHPYVRDRVVATTPMEIGATTRDVGQMTLTLARKRRHEHQEELLALFESEVHRRGGRAVGGLERVLNAVQQGQVQALLLQEHYQASGGQCHQCGALTTEPQGACGYCGGIVEQVDDMVEPLVAAGFQQGAEVVFLANRQDQRRLQPFGGLGAILRFPA